MILRLLIIVLSALVVTACSATKEHRNFKYAKKEFTINRPTLLRTDGVYIRSGVLRKNEYRLNDEHYYFYYRFYENGRCYNSPWYDGKINEDSLKILSLGGQRTFFRNNANTINIELWGGWYAGYIIYTAVADGKGFTIVSGKSRGGGEQAVNYRYEFKSVEFTEEKADW